MSQREEVMVQLGVDNSAIKQGLATATDHIEKFAHEIKGMLIGVFSIESAISGIEKLGEFVKTFKRISEGTGLSTTLTQDMLNVSKAVGIAEGSVESMLDKFTKNLKPGSDPDVALMQFADHLASIEDPGERARLVIENFGKAGVKLIPVLAQGSAGIRQIGEEFGRITDAQAEQIHRAEVTMEKFSGKLKVLGASMLEGLSVLYRGVEIEGQQGTSIFESITKAQDELEERDRAESNKAERDHVKAMADSRSKAKEEERVKEEAKEQDFNAKVEMRAAIRADKEKDRKQKQFDRDLKNAEKLNAHILELQQNLADARGGEFLPTLHELATSGRWMPGRPLVSRGGFVSGPFARDAQRLEFLEGDAKDSATFGDKDRRARDLKEIQSIRDRLRRAGVYQDPNQSLIDRIDKLQDEGMPVDVKVAE